MNTIRELWRSNPYAVAAAVVAPIVFGIVFAAIWLLATGGGDSLTTAEVDRADAPAPTVVQVASEPEQDASAAPAAENGDAAGQAAGSDPQQALSADQSGQAGGGQSEPAADEQPQAEPMPTLEDVLVTQIDDSSFRYGTEEERGAILPIDNGIVPSSGPKHRTSWELLLPTARIRADIVSLGRTPRGNIGAPDNPFVVGWFNRSATPGEPGNAILAGHRDYEDIDGNVGAGVCWELDRVKVGDQMVIRDAERDLAWVYEVTEAVVIDPNDPDASRYLADTSTSVITLITCTGSFDASTHRYSHRLVVVGQLQATASA